MGNSAPSTITIDPAQFRERHIHFVAAHLPGMAAVAALLQHAGARCSRCEEPQPTAPCQQIRKHAPDMLVAPAAITQTYATHPDLSFAAERQIPVMASPWLLGALIAQQCVCAVLGPQASRAASWLRRIMERAGAAPSFADTLVERAEPHWGQSPLCIVTADAAFGSFHALHPRVALITGIPDRVIPGYDDIAAVQRAFDAFIAGMDLYSPWPSPPTVILNDDDAGCRLLAARMAAWPGHVVRYRLAPLARTSHQPTHLALHMRFRDSADNMSLTVPVAMQPHLTSLLGALFASRSLDAEPKAIASALAGDMLLTEDNPPA